MGLRAVMNRCAAVEGGAEGGEKRVGERMDVGEEVMGEEELEMGCACMCCCDCGFSVADYWNCVVCTTETLLLFSSAPSFGD